MSINTAKDALQAYFMTKWAAAGYNADHVKIENVKFPVPDSDTWVGLIIKESSEESREFGVTNVNYKHKGMIIVQFFAKAGTGTAAQDTLIDVVSGWLRGEPVSGYIFTDEPFSVFAGSENKQGDYQVNVNFPFHYNEQHTLNTA